jgi:hypothetical protein
MSPKAAVTAGLGIADMNLFQNNLRPNQDYESNSVMRIITIIHRILTKTKGSTDSESAGEVLNEALKALALGGSLTTTGLFR